VTKDIKAGVIWAGVVGSYADLLERWRRRNPPPTTGDQPTPSPGRRWRQEFVERYGEPSANPNFWNAISPINFVGDVAPISIHHGTRDASVPIEFSDSLAAKLKENKREYEYFIYQGDNHNLSNNLSLALRRSVAFFDKHVKNRKTNDA
jgi:dipeptidyl aminopeptidase/acylaminoacyl peptidase